MTPTLIAVDNQMPIPNHYSAKMSELDLAVAKCVPAGGNWKDVPDSVGCARITGIRESYAAGQGSRSTYYGRLRADRPSYTINTYFSRPGNGCHLHYDFAGGQHRVLSEREAARLQSFPDSFVFCGSHRAVHQQIGNAVPPLLAYQIARVLPFAGYFVDLFCGAGGLALGFVWAGWTPLVSNDFTPSFIETHTRNFGTPAVCGDVRDAAIVARILEEVRRARELNPEVPLLILGGPPCQGFSTAGNKRSMDDDRNHLFLDYRNLVDLIQPDGFVFENVMGLLNMEGGKVFESVRAELERPGFTMNWRVLDAEEYAVPQRRKRVVITSLRDELGAWPTPSPTTGSSKSVDPFDLPAPLTVGEAISDLPPLEPGVDGSDLDYLGNPANAYQALMRSRLSPAEYLTSPHASYDSAAIESGSKSSSAAS